MKFTLPLSFVLLLGGVLLAQAADTAAPTAPAASDIIRIKAGVTAPLVDETGTVWRADTGFIDGETIERPGLPIANTKTPSVYQAERFDMREFHWKLPNGKYTVRLHFCETYEGIYGPGERVFSFKVEGREFKDFDVWKKSGGAYRAYVESVEVEVADGSLDIFFTSQVENPEINALEIIPAK
jgi:Malectin domain